MSERATGKTAPKWGIRAIVITTSIAILVIAILMPTLVTLLILGALVAYILDPLVQLLERRGPGRVLATSVVFIGLTLLVAALMIVLVPAVVGQFKELMTMDVSRASQSFESTNLRITNWFERLGIEDVDVLGSLITYVGEHVPAVINFLPNALSFLSVLALFPFIVFFLLKDGRLLKKNALSLIPNRYFEFSLSLIFKMDRQLGNYLRGQLIEALVVGVASIIVLWIVDVPYFLPIGIFAGAANFVPYLGPAAGAVTAVTVVLLSGGSLATSLLIVGLFSGIQLLENGIVQPLVMSRNVQMHPLAIVISVLVGGQLFGFIGLLLAVPAVAIARVFIVETVAALKRYQYASS